MSNRRIDWITVAYVVLAVACTALVVSIVLTVAMSP